MANMECGAVRERMVDFLYGELAGEERVAFEAHLGGCTDCRREVDAFNETRRIVRQAQDEPVPERSRARILEAAREAAARAADAQGHAFAHPGRAQASGAPGAAAGTGILARWLEWLRGHWQMPTLATAGAVALFLLTSRLFMKPEEVQQAGRRLLAPAPATSEAGGPPPAKPAEAPADLPARAEGTVAAGAPSPEMRAMAAAGAHGSGGGRAAIADEATRRPSGEVGQGAGARLDALVGGQGAGARLDTFGGGQGAGALAKTKSVGQVGLGRSASDGRGPEGERRRAAEPFPAAGVTGARASGAGLGDEAPKGGAAAGVDDQIAADLGGRGAAPRPARAQSAAGQGGLGAAQPGARTGAKEAGAAGAQAYGQASAEGKASAALADRPAAPAAMATPSASASAQARGGGATSDAQAARPAMPTYRQVPAEAAPAPAPPPAPPSQRNAASPSRAKDQGGGLPATRTGQAKAEADEEKAPVQAPAERAAKKAQSRDEPQREQDAGMAVLVERADRAFTEQRWKDAKDLYERLLRGYPTHVDADRWRRRATQASLHLH